uniref:Uncharacterized protein n=1 Tax=Parascaris univalens TaxID=6257 RepID=A0A915AGJ2_PARUN
MYIWEWRRRYRQAMRSWRPPVNMSYAQASRRRLFISFILFFIGWKIIGITLNESLFYKRDEVTGEMRLFSPAEMKQRLLDKMEKPPELPPSVSKPFPLDD